MKTSFNKAVWTGNPVYTIDDNDNRTIKCMYWDSLPTRSKLRVFMDSALLANKAITKSMRAHP
jgi:hypothetical protein